MLSLLNHALNNLISRNIRSFYQSWTLAIIYDCNYKKSLFYGIKEQIVFFI